MPLSANDLYSMFGGVGDAITEGIKNARLAQEEQRKEQLRNTLAGVGAQLSAGGKVDYRGIAASLLPHDPASALGILKYGEEEESNAEARRIVGGGGGVSAARPVNLGGDAAAVRDQFIGTTKEAGLTNPNALAVLTSHGIGESGFDPAKVNRTWSDPSQSGQPGTSGGILSWRNDRLKRLQNFAASQGEQPGAITPRTQALFFAQEDPEFFARFQASPSLEAAHDLFSKKWAYAGYDQPGGGEYATRLERARSLLPTFQPGLPTNQVAGPGAPAVPPQAQPGSSTPPIASATPQAPISSFGPDVQQHADRLERLRRGILLAKGAQVQNYQHEIDKEREFLDKQVRTLDPSEYPRFNVPADFKGTVQVDMHNKVSAPLKAAAEVNIGQEGESAAAKALGTAVGTEVGEYVKAGRPAAEMRRQLAYMKNALDTGGDNIFTGPGAQIVLRGKQFLSQVTGQNLEGTTETEALQKLGFGLATQAVQAISSRPTQMEFGRALENNPGLFLSRPGNYAMIHILNQQAARTGDLAKLAAREKDPSAFAEKVDAYDAAHPIISPFRPGKEFDQSDIDTLTRAAGPNGAPPPPAPTPIGSQQEYDALKPGASYTAPDGSVRTKR